MESILRKFQDEAIVLMEKLIQALKCTFSHKFLQGFWQDNYCDSEHFASCVRYISRNPRHLPKILAEVQETGEFLVLANNYQRTSAQEPGLRLPERPA